MTEMDEQMDRVLVGLRRALAARESHDRNPTLTYCLICDEHALLVHDGSSYPRLDCRHEHYESILEESHDNPQIVSWVACINHFRSTGELA